MSSRLSNRQIIEDYIAILDSLSREADIKKYLELNYPLHLLPHNKETITRAIQELKEEAFIGKDYELVHLLDWGKHQLELFEN